jgi:hypothetical protein
MIIKKKSKGEIYDIIIDNEDYEKFCEHTWYITHKHTKYCRTNIYINGKKTTLKLHRFLMNLENGDERIINHIDGNGLNNVKSNLEICDQMYNTQSINKKTRFGCITILNDREKKYEAKVTINKKRYRKCFYTKEEAEAWLDGLKQIAIAETVPFQ